MIYNKEKIEQAIRALMPPNLNRSVCRYYDEYTEAVVDKEQREKDLNMWRHLYAYVETKEMLFKLENCQRVNAPNLAKVTLGRYQDFEKDGGINLYYSLCAAYKLVPIYEDKLKELDENPIVQEAKKAYEKQFPERPKR